MPAASKNVLISETREDTNGNGDLCMVSKDDAYMVNEQLKTKVALDSSFEVGVISSDDDNPLKKRVQMKYKKDLERKKL